MNNNTASYTFVIDTDQYAGNFERELCAYLTGIVGECGVGSEFKDIARKEIPEDLQEELDKIIAHVPDDEHGCSRPVIIWQSENYWSDGMGNEWSNSDTDTEKHLAAYVKSHEEIYGNSMRQPMQMLREHQEGKSFPEGWTQKDCREAIEEDLKEIEDAKKVKKLERFPAYNSVGIHMEENPSPKLIELLKERALKFPEAKRQSGAEWDKNFQLSIEGFRLLQHSKISIQTRL